MKMNKQINGLVLVLAGILAALPCGGQTQDWLVAGRYGWWLRDPQGLAVYACSEVVNYANLTVEEWFRDPRGACTQRLDQVEAVRVGYWSWQDSTHTRVEWTNGVAYTNDVLDTRHTRGFSGGGHTGTGTWLASDGYRTVLVAMAEWEVRWSRTQTMCTNGCNATSAFEFQSFPMTAIDLRTMSTCTINSVDARSAFVTIPVPLDSYWTYVGRAECYYCDGSRPCWEYSWPKLWTQPTLAKNGPYVTIKLPVETGATVNVLRSPNLESWEWVGTATEENGSITFTDTNAPAQRAFYKTL